MRVTSELMVTNTVRRLSQRMEQYEGAQSRLATGKEIRRPSDDPSAANRALSLRATVGAHEQAARNAQDGLSWLDATDTQLQSALQRVQRARDLTVQGLNPIGDLPREAVADEIAAVRDELVGIANSDLRGQHLFSGFRDQPAVVEAGGDWHYRDPGDPFPVGPDEIVRRVGSNDRVRVNVTAAEAFFAPGGVDNLFATLRDIETALRTEDQATLAAGLGRLDDARTRIGTSLAAVGANTNWLEAARDRSANAVHVARRELVEVEDADYAEAVMELQVQDVALQSTLQALARAMPQSLAAFLR